MGEGAIGILVIIAILFSVVNAGLLAVLLSRRGRDADAARADRELLSAAQKHSSELVDSRLRDMNRALGEKQDMTLRAVETQLSSIERHLKTANEQQEQKLENIRTAVEKRLSYIQEDNNQKLEQIRKIVDEKLEEKMNESFRLVSQQLEQVHKGLGEMQSLASGVGDLKKVLSNVKTRGILGEIQLGAIFEEILSPEQYIVNAAPYKGARERVEFAVKFPGDDGSPVLLPVDSKFPLDIYTQLLDAYETGSKETVAAAVTALKTRLKGCAKDIRDKYVSPPETTDFGILFLPTEGLYAEAVKAGMVESLQSEYKVSLAGPSTMAALLNSLQMGFRTLAIQKRSSEVWKVLGAVKNEFDKFANVLESTQKRLELANKDLDALIGVRSRAIRQKLKNVARLDEAESGAYLPAGDEYYDTDNTEGGSL